MSSHNKIKTIAVTGGKGGTGKSTVAVLMAADLARQGKNVVLVDCDVECPNDYLLTGVTLEEPCEKVYGEFPELDKSRCQKCGECVEVCRENAVFQAPGQYPVFIRELCSGCGACWLACPHGAIQPEKEETGQIYANKIQDSKNKDFYLITGSAKPGLEETGPVAAETKKFALSFAEGQQADTVLLDTAAGTHCPVIAALMGCDLVLCVTESTPMGCYDLRIVLDLCRKLKVPAEIILNQADLGDKKGIKRIAKQFAAKIKQEISYSKRIAQAYSKGSLLDLKNIITI